MACVGPAVVGGLRRVAVLTLVLLLASCASGKSSSSPPSTVATTTTRPAYTPVFAKGPCNDEVPQDARIECGSLTVPEDRSKTNGRKVVLPVAILHAADPMPASDPVVYLSGGPGFAGLTEMHTFLERSYTGNRDAILFDQRGTGRAEPSLACPEVYAANATINGNVQSFGTAEKLSNDAALACRDRLRASGVNLNQYNTSAVADDVADLRVAMGIKEWNLFGVSYGTTVALQTMRAHPEGIRSVVIDSVFPTDAKWNASEAVTNFERVQRVFFGGCAQDAACRAKFPNLEADFRDAVAALDASPHETTFDDPTSKQKSRFIVDGQTAVSGFFNALYDSDLIPVLPGVIEQVKAGTAGPILDALVQQLGPEINGAAEAQKDAVNCSDRAFSVRSDDVAPLLATHPEYSRFLLGYTVCLQFGVAPAPAGFNDPVRSDIPTLLLADEYDPVTPPADSRRASESLSRSTFVLFPGLGHGAVFSDRDCPGAVFRGFLAAPTAAVDTACVASMGPPKWNVG